MWNKLNKIIMRNEKFSFTYLLMFLTHQFSVISRCCSVSCLYDVLVAGQQHGSHVHGNELAVIDATAIGSVDTACGPVTSASHDESQTASFPSSTCLAGLSTKRSRYHRLCDNCTVLFLKKQFQTMIERVSSGSLLWRRIQAKWFKSRKRQGNWKHSTTHGRRSDRLHDQTIDASRA